MKTIKIILFLISLFMIHACGSRKPTVALDNHTDSIYIDKLVPFPSPPDSASIRALMECDENGRVVLRWLDISNTKNIQLMFTLDSLGNIISNMVVPGDTAWLPSKEIYVDRKVKIPVLVEKELSRWQQFKIEIGGWAIGLLSGILILFVGYFIVRLARKKK